MSSFWFAFWQSSRKRAQLCFFPVDFLLRLACSSLTSRSWFIEALRCINDLVHSEHPIITMLVFRMISATVIGLRLESDIINFFYNSWNFPPSAAFACQIYKSTYRNLDGHEFLYSLFRFRPVYPLFICSVCLFIYVIIIFSPIDDIFYVIRNSSFIIDWNISKLELESNLNSWANSRSDLSLKLHLFKGN